MLESLKNPVDVFKFMSLVGREAELLPTQRKFQVAGFVMSKVAEGAFKGQRAVEMSAYDFYDWGISAVFDGFEVLREFGFEVVENNLGDPTISW